MSNLKRGSEHMKGIYLLSTLIFLSFNLVGQTCDLSEPTFSTQEQIDNFIIDNPDCIEITSNLKIQGQGITNLLGFSQISSIDGDLTIQYSDSLTSLEGLQSLTFIDGNLKIRQNCGLKNLSGLENLTTIAGDFQVIEQDSFYSLAGLDNLENIDGLFEVKNNDTLVNLAGLNSLQNLGGDLTIQSNSSLIDLSGLEGVSFITGEVLVQSNDNLEYLSGLQNLVQAASVDIRFNSKLRNVLGLSSLTEVNYNISIYNSDSMEFLTGLENLTSVGSDFLFQENSRVKNLDALQNLPSVGGSLFINGFDSLKNLQGLSGLTSVGGDLSVSYNFNLKSLDGLENLTHIGEDLFMSNNIRLENVTGLRNLETIVGSFTLINHDQLVSLYDMESLTTLGECSIYYNDNLSICSNYGICSILPNQFDVFFQDNAYGCNNAIQAGFHCGLLGRVNHRAFYDLNENGTLDPGEEHYPPGANVHVSPGDFTSLSIGEDGGFAYLDFGSYTISYLQDASPNWDLTTGASSYNVVLTPGNSRDTVYFGLVPNVAISDVHAAIASGVQRCAEYSTFDVISVNTGTTIMETTTWLEVDENILNVNFIDTPDTIVAPNRYGWHHSGHFPGNSIHKKIDLLLPFPPDFPLEDSLYFESWVDYTDVNGSAQSEHHSYNLGVLCSYDPNDKLVSPVYPNNYSLIDEYLTYTVRFQNTGNAEAFEVIIEDELDDNLDPATFQFIGSSHEDVLDLQMKDDKYLSFRFKNINLPDSTTNFNESQGYVMYRIKAVEDIPENTYVNNKAGIYFDFNNVVNTNTTVNLMVSEFPFDISTKDISSSNIKIYPNPTKGIFTISSEQAINGKLRVQHVTGRSVIEQTINGSTNIDLSSLADGVYLITIENEGIFFSEMVIKI